MQIPTTKEDLSTEWFQKVLPNSNIKEVQVKRIAEGNGTMGRIFHVDLKYSGNTDLPDSLVVKLPTDDQFNLKVGISLGLYSKEAKFFGKITKMMDSVAPKCYYYDYKGEDQMVVIMQDLSKTGEFANQFKGATEQHIETGLNYLAGIHSEFLLDKKKAQFVEELCPSNPIDSYKWLTDSLPKMITRSFELLDNKTMPLEYKGSTFEKLGKKILEDKDFFWKAFSTCESRLKTFIHGDFRLDNIWFSDDQKLINPCDWQATGMENPMSDLLIWILEVAKDVPSEFIPLITRYHQKMVERGIKDYKLEDCIIDARLFAFYKIFIRCLYVIACITFWEDPKVLKSCIFCIDQSFKVIDQTDISFYDKLEAIGTDPLLK